MVDFEPEIERLLEEVDSDLLKICIDTGQQVTSLSADIVSCLASRELEDDAMVNFRMDGGAIGRLWTSSVAIGNQHGLSIQVLVKRWPALVTGTSQSVVLDAIERTPLAFANIYKDLPDAIHAIERQPQY